MSNEEETKVCPCCGEEILATAVKCKHCGEFIQEIEGLGIEKMPTWLFAILAICTGGLFSLAWVYKTITELNKLNENSKEKISIWIPITYMLIEVILIPLLARATLSMPLVLGVVGWLNYFIIAGFYIFISFKAIQAIEIQAMTKYNKKIEHNALAMVFFNVIYLNFAVNTYEERVRG